METTAIAILITSFLLLMAARLPIVFALSLSSLLTTLYLGLPLAVIAQAMIKSIYTFSLLAIPFCILAGEIMREGTITKKLISLSNAFIGHLRGGLALVNVSACMFFGGMTGSSVADASCIGATVIPMMKEKGYDADYAATVTAIASTQGILVPPSHNAVMYAIVAGGVSIAKMLVAGIIPGFFVGLGTACLAYMLAVKRKYPVEAKAGRQERVRAVKAAILPLFAIMIVFGGIFCGIYTIIESNAMMVVYVFCLAGFLYRELSLKSIRLILTRSINTLAGVIVLISFSGPFGWLLAYLKVPAILTAAILDFSSNEVVVMLLMTFILLLLGCIIDTTPTLIICTPIMLPIVTRFGIDPIQFGVIMLLTICIALVHPPLGCSLFIASAIAKVPVEKVTMTAIPFYIMMILVLLLVTLVPEVTMFLPNKL
ncbi:MAG: TRAP transporter large permease [Negativicutes bacterium]|nr:TRAP transporter large permease [Negativicutes bacterium]